MENLQIKIEEEVLHLLLQKGFGYHLYENEELNFYRKDVNDKDFVIRLLNAHYSSEDDFDIDNVNVVVEVSTDFKYAQYSFSGGFEEFHVYDNLIEFKTLLELLPDECKISR